MGLVNCETCHGTGIEEYWDDNSEAELRRDCTVCRGSGQVEENMELQALVDRNLDVAVQENGYAELVTKSPEDVAIDLCSYSQEVEDADVDDVVACVSAWQAKQKQRKQTENKQMNETPRREDFDDWMGEIEHLAAMDNIDHHTMSRYVLRQMFRKGMSPAAAISDVLHGREGDVAEPVDRYADGEPVEPGWNQRTEGKQMSNNKRTNEASRSSGVPEVREVCPECGSVSLVTYMDDAWTCTECGENFTEEELIDAARPYPRDADTEAGWLSDEERGLPPSPSVTGRSYMKGPRHEGMQMTEATDFDKFMDRTLIDERRAKLVDAPEDNPQRRRAMTHQNRPADRTRFTKAGK